MSQFPSAVQAGLYLLVATAITHLPIEYIGRSGWMNLAVLISWPSFFAAMDCFMN